MRSSVDSLKGCFLCNELECLPQPGHRHSRCLFREDYRTWHGISPFLLKTYAEFVCCWCSSLFLHLIIVIRPASILPPYPIQMFRPVALTSVVMKCLEKCVMFLLKVDMNSKLDLLQFACWQERSKDNAVPAFSHTQSLCSAAFIDFIRALNTLQPHLSNFDSWMSTLQLSSGITIFNKHNLAG